MTQKEITVTYLLTQVKMSHLRLELFSLVTWLCPYLWRQMCKIPKGIFTKISQWIPKEWDHLRVVMRWIESITFCFDHRWEWDTCGHLGHHINWPCYSACVSLFFLCSCFLYDISLDFRMHFYRFIFYSQMCCHCKLKYGLYLNML